MDGGSNGPTVAEAARDCRCTDLEREEQQRDERLVLDLYGYRAVVGVVRWLICASHNRRLSSAEGDRRVHAAWRRPQLKGPER